MKRRPWVCAKWRVVVARPLFVQAVSARRPLKGPNCVEWTDERRWEGGRDASGRRGAKRF